MMMTYDPEFHHRSSIRLRGYDYSCAGAYFVTLCTYGRECLFGDVADGEMRLNEFGGIVRECWLAIPDHFPAVTLDASVVMPNHTHGIVVVSDVGARHASPITRKAYDGSMENDIRQNHATQNRATHASPLRCGAVAVSLGAIVGSFKSAATKRINALRDNPGCPVWQRNYHERIIRSDPELAGIREYIVNNPLQWVLDRENPVNLKTNP